MRWRLSPAVGIQAGAAERKQAIGMMGIGIGAALVHPQLSGAVVALVPADQSGMASAVTVVMRQGGFAIGIAALGAVLGSETAAASYLGPFAVASAACVCGLIAALSLLPNLSPKSPK
jgi:hypothetical protein